MKKTTTLARFGRAFRRGVAAVLATIVLSALALPITASATTLNVAAAIHIILPDDGVGDSPPVP